MLADHSGLFQTLVVGTLLIALAAGCGPSRADTSRTDDARPGTATVEEIDLLIMESFPVQVAVVARGYLADGCTEIDQVLTTFDAGRDMFDVEITTARDQDAVCTQALVPFEKRVELDIYGLPAGTYTVEANSVQESFQLAVDNVFPESTSTDVPWTEARDRILAGEVVQVTQLHSLDVTLELMDGQQLVTREPAINAVFDIVDACGEACAHIVLVTE